MGVTACSVSVRSSDPSEDAYRRSWRVGVGEVTAAAEPFKTGVCNVGGDQNGCYRASAALAETIGGLLSDLAALDVPSHFEDGDRRTRAALTTWQRGLTLRNSGFEHQSDAEFQEGNKLIDVGLKGLVTAYQAFPPAGRPQPPLTG